MFNIDCDWHNGEPEPCPGLPAHCAKGEHCTSTDAACNAERRVDDHASTCHSCGAALHVHIWDDQDRCTCGAVAP